jgi:hypothetical protein
MVNTPKASAAKVAAALSIDLIAPALDDLHTFDGSHLDPESAERWSRAFLKDAGSHIQACLDESKPARPVKSTAVTVQ